MAALGAAARGHAALACRAAAGRGRPAAPAGAAAAPPVGARGFAHQPARHRGTVYVPRLVARKTLLKAAQRKNQDPTLLLPPYVSASELRVIFRLDYSGIFHLLGVRHHDKRYYWKDFEGRKYETTSKRKVLVPFDVAAVPAEGLGFRPRKVDVEPDWAVDSEGRPRLPSSGAAAAPVVAVLGHINHGKTTLLDALCGTKEAAAEPGGITQGVRAMTGHLGGLARLQLGGAAPRGRGGDDRGPPSDGAAWADAGAESQRAALEQALPSDQPEQMTFLDTPGHEAFDALRGRVVAAADAVVVVVSVERGAEVQTEEVLMHAARWGAPVVFALNKVDLPGAHVELTRAELRRQCQILYERGLVGVDWSREAEQAVPISALHKTNLDGLVARLRGTLGALPCLPRQAVPPPTSTPGEARRWKEVQRRTDFLVGAEDPPSAVALVVELERPEENQGEQLLTLIVHAGRLVVGQYFVVGSAFGRVMTLAVAVGSDRRSWAKVDSATAGVAVQVTGLKTKQLGGDCSPDDLLFALPRERAWRLSEHRRRIEALATLQTEGPELKVPWEHDGPAVNPRTQAAFDRSEVTQPEQHSSSAYQRRWAQAAVEEVTAGAAGPSGAFSSASRREFFTPLGMTSAEQDSDEERALGVPAGTPGRGRRSAQAQPRPSAAARRGGGAGEGPAAAAPARPERRFLAVPPGGEEGAEEAAEGAEGPGAARSAAGRGRHSARAARVQTGAWTESAGGPGAPGPGDDFVYYASRRTWTEEADIDTARNRARWRWRDLGRWDEQERQQDLKEREKSLAAETRRRVFGEKEDQGEGAEDELVELDDEAEEVEPLPRRNAPIVSMILKTRSVTQFDVLMDEVERVQEQYGIRIVIVHGGLGPVIIKDVTHAEVEKGYGFCPIYAFQVGVHPDAAAQADSQQIDVRRFSVFTDLIADVANRCERIDRKEALQNYSDALKDKPTLSGI